MEMNVARRPSRRDGSVPATPIQPQTFSIDEYPDRKLVRPATS